MKSHFLTSILLLCMGFGLQAQENANPTPPPPGPATVFDGVLKIAEWAKFPYKDVLANAEACDIKYIDSFLQFSGTVDGRDALNHAVTCLELIRLASDDCFGFSVAQQKPKLKAVLLDRLTLAQGRTKMEELRKPMAEWAPVTWAALNNKPLPPIKNLKRTSCMDGEDQKKPATADPARPQAPASDAEIRN